MENTQFFLLNALFGGKLASDALSGVKPISSEESGAENGKGFFSFLENLLTAKPETGDEFVNVAVAQPSTFSAEELRASLKSDVPPNASIAVPGEVNLAPGAPANVGELQTDVTAPQAELVTPQQALEIDVKPVTPELVKPDIVVAAPAKSVNPALTAAAAGTALKTGQPGVSSIGTIAPGVPDAPIEKAAATFVDPIVEFSPREGELRFDSLPARSGIKTSAVNPNLTPPGASAIVDHAAPEALIHSALTREEAAILDADRMTTQRLELATHAADRNMHLNPVRDQIAAAVAARHNDGKLEIRLDPPELGRVMIGFERDGADIVRAVVTADSPETLDLMRRNADVFQRALEAQGFENLDLQFADRGPREDAEQDGEEAFKSLQLSEEGGASGLTPPAMLVADGRLDRRL